MDEQIIELLTHIEDKAAALPAGRRLLIAVSGIPGSGKTTLVESLANVLNAASQMNGDPDRVAVVPMDGFHLTRRQLDALPDPAEAHARRGAPFTFDPAGLLQLVKSLKKVEPFSIYAPSFDHARKDPVEDDIEITPQQRIVLLEGNYLHLREPPWNEIAAEMDELWLVTVDEAVARKRVARRHVAAGITPTFEKAVERFDTNDLPNGHYILSSSLPPHRTIVSVEIEAGGDDEDDDWDDEDEAEDDEEYDEDDDEDDEEYDEDEDDEDDEEEEEAKDK